MTHCLPEAVRAARRLLPQARTPDTTVSGRKCRTERLRLNLACSSLVLFKMDYANRRELSNAKDE
jgi:hypothetical protein